MSTTTKTTEIEQYWAEHAAIDDETGKPLTLYASEEAGMTCGPMPCWSRFGPKYFTTYQDAVNWCKHLSGYGYRWTLDQTADPIFFWRKVTTTVEIETIQLTAA